MKITNAPLSPFLTVFVSSVLIWATPQRALKAEDKPDSESRSGSTIYALEISGGNFTHKGQKTEANLTSLVDALRDLYPKINIAVAPEVARTKIPDLKLHFSQLEDTLEAMRVASGYRFTWRRGRGAAGVDPNTGLPTPALESALYVLDLGTEPPSPHKRAVEVFNLSGYLQQMGKRDPKEIHESLRQIEAMVRDTLQMLEQDEFANEGRPDFRFHPGANLLIVSGSSEAIEVARKVVTALPGLAPGLVTPSPRPAGTRMMPDALMQRYGLNPPVPTRPAEPEPSPEPAR